MNKSVYDAIMLWCIMKTGLQSKITNEKQISTFKMIQKLAESKPKILCGTPALKDKHILNLNVRLYHNHT